MCHASTCTVMPVGGPEARLPYHFRMRCTNPKPETTRPTFIAASLCAMPRESGSGSMKRWLSCSSMSPALGEGPLIPPLALPLTDKASLYQRITHTEMAEREGVDSASSCRAATQSVDGGQLPSGTVESAAHAVHTHCATSRHMMPLFTPFRRNLPLAWTRVSQRLGHDSKCF